ncbi:hypothetical protein MTO96_052388 [Rhipicephalus appendiculatus]
MAYSVANDVLLLETLSCSEIDDILLLQCAPAVRRNLCERGLFNVEAIDSDDFYRLFRFRKMDLTDLLSALLVPEEIVSAQRVRVPGKRETERLFAVSHTRTACASSSCCSTDTARSSQAWYPRCSRTWNTTSIIYWQT